MQVATLQCLARQGHFLVRELNITQIARVKTPFHHEAILQEGVGVRVFPAKFAKTAISISGSSFRTRAKTPNNVLIVNLTTLTPLKEQACVLDVGDHIWIRHRSCVNYQDAIVTTLEKLNAARDGGVFRMQDRLTPAILKKIRQGALGSERMSMDNAENMFAQELVDSEDEPAGDS